LGGIFLVVDAIAATNSAVPKWARIVLRSVGVVNACLAVLGGSGLVETTYRIVKAHKGRPVQPYFWGAFATMDLLNVIFLFALLIVAVQFIRIRTSLIDAYAIGVLILFAYDESIGMMWWAGKGAAHAVAAATGVGNIGIAPFEFLFVAPYLYPLVTVVLLQVLRRRLQAARQASGEPVLAL
jgi:hypothetical protein